MTSYRALYVDLKEVLIETGNLSLKSQTISFMKLLNKDQNQFFLLHTQGLLNMKVIDQMLIQMTKWVTVL